MQQLLDWLLRSHPEEAKQDVWFQEEARAERVANLMRLTYMLAWILPVISISGAHPISANAVNIGGGFLMASLSIAYHLYLRARPYKPLFKYLSTAADLLLATVTLFVYHYEMGYSTTLKAPPFMNYLAVLSLTAFRFSTALPTFAGIMSVFAYSGLFVYMLLTQDVLFGTPLEIFTTPKINLSYQLIRLEFLILFAALGFLLAKNVQRLVRLRVEEMSKALIEKNKHEQTLSLFERYFSPGIARYLTDHPQDLGGQVRQVTVLLTDLRGFTALSEGLGPVESVSLLNRMFEHLVAIVFKYEGTLDKFTGDGMLVVFGVPDTRPDDASRALMAAQEMIASINKIGADHDLQLGIAIHTGEVIFGNIGSPTRMELTVIGDTVNTAARMEPLNKEFGTTIIMSETAYQALEKPTRARELPPRRLRGKSGKLKLYTIEAW